MAPDKHNLSWDETGYGIYLSVAVGVLPVTSVFAANQYYSIIFYLFYTTIINLILASFFSM